MSKQTRTVFYLASVYCVGLIVVLVYGILQIREKGIELNSNQELIAEQSAKESAHNNVKQIITSTEDDRLALQKFFITEKDIILFISKIEQVATGLGVELETTQLSVNPKTETSVAQLYTGFKFQGSKTAVEQLVKLLENIPYHKSIPELVLTRKPDTGIWEGSVLLYITIAS